MSIKYIAMMGLSVLVAACASNSPRQRTAQELAQQWHDGQRQTPPNPYYYVPPKVNPGRLPTPNPYADNPPYPPMMYWHNPVAQAPKPPQQLYPSYDSSADNPSFAPPSNRPSQRLYRTPLPRRYPTYDSSADNESYAPTPPKGGFKRPLFTD